MTAAVQCRMMSDTTVNIAITTIVPTAAHAANPAMLRSAWVALMSVHHVMNRSAATAQQYAKIAVKNSVRIV